MIQDISPHRFDNEFDAKAKLSDSDYVFHFQNNQLLVLTQGEVNADEGAVEHDFDIPKANDFTAIPNKESAIYLFRLNGTACFLLNQAPTVETPKLSYQDISFFRNSKHKEIAWISVTALHLMNWYSQHQYCGRCGTRTEHKQDERALVCPKCNLLNYPKISPAIIVAITCKDQILLARNSAFPGRWYSLIAGYVDIGETLEETVWREVKEEVGLDVTNIQYYKSQPWALSGSMMIGFTAEADNQQSIQLDTNEICEASWFDRENLPEHPSGISIAGEMIDKFQKGLL